MQNLVGSTLNKYTLLERIGQGGMAEVYRAHQPNLGRDVAIKVMHPHLAETANFTARFEREATAVARLRHPHIVQIYDFDIADSITYMVMEYIAGPTLKQRLAAQQQPFSLSEIRHLFLPLVDAVQYAHSQGIIHRDLKPANIMFTAEDQVILTDFGIAHLSNDIRITATGSVPGTPGYMSPEQGEGEPANERSDIYALGIILYELLTGRLPFDGNTPIAVMMKHLTEPVPSPSHLNPNLPDNIERIVLKALRKTQENRFQTPYDFGEALRQAIDMTSRSVMPGSRHRQTDANQETPISSDKPLQLTLFQSFHATLAGEPLTFRSVKGRALLAYLMVEHDHPHQRETLAGLLWPDELDRKARRNLSQTLLEVRQTIGDRKRESPFLLVSHQAVAFQPNSPVNIDVVTFEAVWQQVQQHDHPHLEHCADCITQLAKAIPLYTGPFLDGFFVANSDLFETWLVTKRKALEQQALLMLIALSNFYAHRTDYDQAQQYVRQRLALIPWQEEAHRQLMYLLALNGQRSLALAQFEICKQVLADELAVSPSAETVAVYEQIREGQLRDSQDARSASGKNTTKAVVARPSTPAPFQAATPPPHFVGRETEMGQLACGLIQPGLTIYALVGMGGVGKTTLATAVAAQVQVDFPDGILWANATTSSPLDILASWGQVYDYDFNALPDLDSRAAAVRGMFRDKQTLLIIDNATAVSTVKPLLPNGSNCAVLLTTRDLDVAYGLNAEVIALGELSLENGLALMGQIFGLDRVTAEPEAAHEICGLLQNLPLAIEIVAQRLKSRPRQRLRHMAVRLHDEQHRLGLQISDQAVRASFAVSWQGLNEALQQIFSLLAVFAGRPFTAVAVAAIAKIDLFDVEDHLDALVALSLLQEEGEMRYRQHALLADFAKDTLPQPDDAYRRMSDYYLTYAQENNTHAKALQLEWGNLTAAITAAYQGQQWSTLITFTDLLAEPWMAHLRYDDARHAYQLVQRAALHITAEIVLATNLLRWGNVCLKQNDLDEAEQHLASSLTLYQRLNDKHGLATVQGRLANIALERNQYNQAKALLLESLTLWVAENDMVGVSEVLYNQAYLYFDLGEYDYAQQVASEALDLLEAHKQQEPVMQMLRLLAHIFLAKGVYDEALAYCERALAVNEMLDAENELAQTLYSYATVLNYQQKYDLALVQAEKSLALAQRQGLRRTVGQVMYQLSLICSGQGDEPQAVDYALQSIEVFENLHDSLSHAYALLHLGRLYHQLDQPNAGQTAWQTVQHIGETLDHAGLLALLQTYRLRYVKLSSE